LSGWTGALITGVDLSAPLTADEVAGIRAALYKWKVVFFRDQRLDHAGQIAFGAQFGDVTPGHPYEGDSAPAGFPQIHTVSPAAYDHRYGPKYRKKQSANGPGWHADVTPLINPPSHSILRAEAVPPYGGDTQFTNVAAVYQGLSPSVRAFIDDLRAEHRFGSTESAERSTEKVGELVCTKALASIHPVVRVHPETKERVVYVNPSFSREIVDHSPRQSRHILDLLFEEIAPSRVFGSLQMGSGKRRVLGQSGRAAPGTTRFRARRRRPRAAPHHLGRRYPGGARRTRVRVDIG
jgi:alpha-ketoglutarate-dependent sulfate ester dioxygenase